MIVGVLLGAGERPKRQTKEELRSLVHKALDAAKSLASEPSLSAQQVAIAVASFLEDAPLTNAGTGSELTRAGTVECDASIVVYSKNRRSQASVGCLTGIKNPCQAAQLLLQKVTEDNNSPMARPVFMVGEGARQLALHGGLEASDLITENSKRVYEYWNDQMLRIEKEASTDAQAEFKDYLVSGKAAKASADPPYQDTIGVLAIDDNGGLAVCSSSGGTLLKLPGRVGPAAVPGAACDVTDECLTVASGFGDDMLACALARIACSTELDCLPEVIESQHMQRDPYYGVLKASRMDNGWLMEAAHTTETMVYGWVGPDNHYEVQVSDKPGVYGARIKD